MFGGARPSAWVRQRTDRHGKDSDDPSNVRKRARKLEKVVFHRLSQFPGMHIEASDGEIGKVKDVYFDDHSWAVRYLVIEAGSWFADRKVLISPISVSRIDWDNRSIGLNLTRREVQASPSIDTDKPVSRQHEVDFFDYYGYPYYWCGPSLWGETSGPMSPIGPIPPVRNAPDVHGESPLDPRLRSAVEVIGYKIQTDDTSMGHVEDFLLDLETWSVRYLVINTRIWLSGRHVVIPPQWIRAVDWTQRNVSIDVSSDLVKASPEFDWSSSAFSRAHETNLYRHYQRLEVPMPAPGRPGMYKCTPIDPLKREEMIRRAAYFRSQLREPCLTHEAEDWLAAERQIDRMLTGHV
jgi:sporulation protein YlmC with PRC-barrel domain